MRNQTHGRSFPSAGCIAILCAVLMSTAFGGPSSGAVFEMEEFSVFEDEGSATQRIPAGQSAACEDEPSEKVTAYPAFRSQNPAYGSIAFASDLTSLTSGPEYCFAIDESGGTDTGYDRFYFDINHDFDLTNDAALGRMLNPPADSESGRGRENIVFDFVQVDLGALSGEGRCLQKVMPRLTQFSEYRYISFVVPTARRGKIKIGAKEYEAVLAQSPFVTGRYDLPVTGLHLDGATDQLPFLSYWRRIDGTFYVLSATPAGDQLTVRPYDGAFGSFEVGPGERGVETSVERGYILNRDVMLDLGKCEKIDGKLRVPVGDYMPLQLQARLGELRVGLRADLSSPREQGKAPVFGIQIRQDKPFVLDFSAEPQVVFRNPASKQRFKLGEQFKAEAVVRDSVLDVLIAGLDDTTKKRQTIQTPDGPYDLYESLDPTVRIVNASGECVAEGPMPFG